MLAFVLPVAVLVWHARVMNALPLEVLPADFLSTEACVLVGERQWREQHTTSPLRGSNCLDVPNNGPEPP